MNHGVILLKKNLLLMLLLYLLLQALRAALKKLEGGGSIEDAKAVCEPEVLNQIVKWKVVASSGSYFLLLAVFKIYLLSHFSMLFFAFGTRA